MSKDLVHLLVSCPLEKFPSEIIRRIRSRKSIYVFEKLFHLNRDTGGIFLDTKVIFVRSGKDGRRNDPKKLRASF